ncbi:MAG TPA: glycoside hydrolase family 3 C-terminal domain-containing protein [Streptosporangiaceae bacterium]|nr:glycoside hydrolase family 3 C-terminal domain-containing protein [Streptosporangiaceae bacterium]
MTTGPAHAQHLTPAAGGTPPAAAIRAPAEQALLAALSVPDKVRLLTGAANWRTHGSPAIGLRPMTVSDGPSGVRGVTKDERHPSTSLPCPSACGATWDTELITELAAALGAEARGKGVDVLLAPTINLMRTPLGGRGFECFSEDPVLTARIAVAFITGLQSAGVAATAKHFVGNDSETGRWTYDAVITEPVLRELYLAPFEACVREAGTGLVMAAYNAVNGTAATAHPWLLRKILKGEWEFGGVVVSDWSAARSTVATAVAGLDLAMPGPNGPWGADLVQAVLDGVVPEAVIDDKIARIIGLGRRVGALAAPDGQHAAAAPAGRAADDDGNPAGDGKRPRARTALIDPGLVRRATAATFVLLRNEGPVLPFDASTIGSIALIGPNAVYPVIQGGGSAVVAPVTVSTPAMALPAALAGRGTVTVAPGCRTWTTVPEPVAGSIRDPLTGEPGLRLEFRDGGGTLIGHEHRVSTELAWWDEGLPPGVGWGEDGTITLLTRFRAGATGPHLIGVAGVGHLTLSVDGAVVADKVTPVPADPVQTMTRPGEVRAMVDLRAGQEAEVRLDFRPADGVDAPLAVRLGIAADEDEDIMIAEAVRAAADAAAAVVVVGSAEAAESEGFDRETLALPGRQDELVARVAAVNPRTVVVVNAGMPVLMPWAGDVAAVVYAWLPGQAMGEALADVLLGRAEPGGRLPVTLPVRESDCPVLHAVPRDGRVDYAEGLLIGYRGYDAAGITPMFAFGHGLGYTQWAYESASVDAPGPAPGEDVRVRVAVRNTGSRPGREIVQAYVAGPAAGAGRPVRVLGAFAAVSAAPGGRAEAVLTVPARALAVWDQAAGDWAWPRGTFTIEVGRSSRDLRLAVAIGLGAGQG